MFYTKILTYIPFKAAVKVNGSFLVETGETLQLYSTRQLPTPTVNVKQRFFVENDKYWDFLTLSVDKWKYLLPLFSSSLVQFFDSKWVDLGSQMPEKQNTVED